MSRKLSTKIKVKEYVGNMNQNNNVFLRGRISMRSNRFSFIVIPVLFVFSICCPAKAADKINLETAASPISVEEKTEPANQVIATCRTEPSDAELNLHITNPENGAVTKDAAIPVTGSTAPGDSVTIDKVYAAVSSTGLFSTTVPLTEGENQIVLIVKHNNRSCKATRTVVMDTTPPLLDISMPTSDLDINSGGCSLVGTGIVCSIAGKTERDANLTINGKSLAVKPNGSFTGKINLDFSDQIIINIAATDPLGNRTTKLLRRDVDTNAVAYLDITVSPDTIYADGKDTAAVIVSASNLIHEPVRATVNLSTTKDGSLGRSVLVTDGGSSTTLFYAGVRGKSVNVTITATSGGITATKTFILKGNTFRWLPWAMRG
jgi:hypothetical protein